MKIDRHMLGICVFIVGTASMSIQARPDTRGFIAASGSNSAMMTIDESGVYPLKTDFTGEILITADDVVLDLRGFAIDGGTNGIRITGNNVTVKNGTVRGATEVGVKIEGDKNRLENLDLVASTTGVELENANANIIENCRALCNTQAGFSLVSSQRNCIINCKAIDNGGNANAFGFVAQDGMCNIFDGCVAENTNTSGVDPFFAAGFLLNLAEQQSKIVHCQASNTEGANAFGILLTADITLNESVNTSSDDPGSRGVVRWQVCDGTKYLATGATSGTRLEIFEFSAAPSAALTSAASNNSATVNWLDWLENSKLLAVGGIGFNFEEVQIFEFDPDAGTVLSISNIFDHGARVGVVKWLACGDSKYVALGGFGSTLPDSIGADVRVLEFNCTTSVLSKICTASFDEPGIVSSVDWLLCEGRKFLAVVSEQSSQRLRVLEFKATDSTLTEVANIIPGARVLSVAWQVCDNTKYLAVGKRQASGGDEVQIFEFSTTASTLALVTGFDVSTDTVNEVSWHVCNGTKYLAAVGDNTDQAKVLEFDPLEATLTEVAKFSHGNILESADWLECGGTTFLGIGGSTSGGVSVRVLEFNGCLSLCNLIKKNHVSGTTSSVTTGTAVGIQDDALDGSTNEIYANFSCKNDINFNIGSQFPISSAQSTGVGKTENIDCSLPATVGPEACMPTLITGATTLSGNGSYCLAQTVVGTITISSVENVTLDLNGYNVRAIDIDSSSKIRVINGGVVDASADGIAISASNTIVLRRLKVENSATDGILIDSASTNILIKDVQVENAGSRGMCIDGAAANTLVQRCVFTNNGSDGVFIDGSNIQFESCISSFNSSNGFDLESTAAECSFKNCQAHSNTATGFEVSGSDNNVFWQCNANSNNDGFVIATGSTGNVVRSCQARSNTTNGFEVAEAAVDTNLVAACYAQGNGTFNYCPSESIKFGATTAFTGQLEYWRNVES